MEFVEMMSASSRFVSLCCIKSHKGWVLLSVTWLDVVRLVKEEPPKKNMCSNGRALARTLLYPISLSSGFWDRLIITDIQISIQRSSSGLLIRHWQAWKGRSTGKHLFILTVIAQTAFHDGNGDYYQSYMWLPCVNRVPAILTPPYCLQDDSVFSPALKIARKPCEGKSKGKYN